ncbi:MAG: hypothetical protein B7Y18_03495, partial [Thiotrichales bacterium 24-47-4]
RRSWLVKAYMAQPRNGMKTIPNGLYCVKNLLKTHLPARNLAFLRGFLPCLSHSHHVFTLFLTAYFVLLCSVAKPA